MVFVADLGGGLYAGVATSFRKPPGGYIRGNLSFAAGLGLYRKI